MKKTGVAIYYANIDRYPQRWLDECFMSILAQTYKDFDIYILDYGKVRSEIPVLPYIEYRHKHLGNCIDAMNDIYTRIFENCEVAVNVNVDDFYDPRRIELLMETISKGADVASSNFHIVNEWSKITSSTHFDKVNIYKQLTQDGVNPVSNPCHIMRRRLFEKLQFNSQSVLYADMDLWKRAIDAGFVIQIRPEYLHYYRMHGGQVTHQEPPA